MQLFNRKKFMPVIITGVTEKGEWLDGYTCSTQDLNSCIEGYVEKRPLCIRVCVDIAITLPANR